MTQFNPENKKTLTYGEALGPAMSITDPEDARQYLDSYVEFIEKEFAAKGRTTDLEGRTALESAKTNLRHYAGYYSFGTLFRVAELFDCHP